MYSRKPHHVDIVHKLLKESGIPRDNLPYTQKFNGLWEKFVDIADLRIGEWPMQDEFWKLICSAAKKGGLAKEKADG